MAKLLKLRRGTTTQHASFTGAEGEVTIDTTKDTAVVHDGSTAGGRPLARQDMNNVPAGTILGTQLENSGVTAGQYGSSSAIPIVTVDAQGLVTAASTTAIDSTTIANGTSNVAVANNGNITATRSGTARLVVDDAGVDVTGDITATGDATFNGGDVTISSTAPRVVLTDTNNNSDFRIAVEGGNFLIEDTTNSNADRLVIDSNGTVSVNGNLDIGAGADVTGNITVTGTVDGVDIATRDTLFGGLTSSSGVLTNGVTATTQSASDNSTKVATTAYVTTGIANAQAFPSGTKMLFQQTAAPTGWTKITSGINNHALRVVSGSAGSGGNVAFTTAFANRGLSANAGNTTAGGNVSVSIGNSTVSGNVSVANATQGGNVSVSVANASAGGTVNSHTLTTSQMPSHSHTFSDHTEDSNRGMAHTHNAYSFNNSLNANRSTANTGGSGGHSHGFTGSSHSHNANATYSGSAHNHNATFSGGSLDHNANATFSGSAHNHSISVANLDMQVEYIDVIIAQKD